MGLRVGGAPLTGYILLLRRPICNRGLDQQAHLEQLPARGHGLRGALLTCSRYRLDQQAYFEQLLASDPRFEIAVGTVPRFCLTCFRLKGASEEQSAALLEAINSTGKVRAPGVACCARRPRAEGRGICGTLRSEFAWRAPARSSVQRPWGPSTPPTRSSGRCWVRAWEGHLLAGGSRVQGPPQSKRSPLLEALHT